MRAEYALSLTL